MVASDIRLYITTIQAVDLNFLRKIGRTGSVTYHMFKQLFLVKIEVVRHACLIYFTEFVKFQNAWAITIS